VSDMAGFVKLGLTCQSINPMEKNIHSSISGILDEVFGGIL